jgi:hypothetical protein
MSSIFGRVFLHESLGIFDGIGAVFIVGGVLTVLVVRVIVCFVSSLTSPASPLLGCAFRLPSSA